MKKPARACCWTEDGESVCCLPEGHKGEHDFTRQCNHTDQPTGYREWHQWAKKKSKTHRQYKCPHCGLWAIWLEKPKKRAIRAGSAEGQRGGLRGKTKCCAMTAGVSRTTSVTNAGPIPRPSEASAKAASPTENTRHSEQDAHWAYITR